MGWGFGNLSDSSTVTPEEIGAASLDSYGKVTPRQMFSRVKFLTGSRNFELDDLGAFLVHNVSFETATITVPPNSTVPFAVGDELEVAENNNSGSLIIAAASGVSLVSVLNGVGVAQNRSITAASGTAVLKQVSPNRWYVKGDLT